MRTSAPALNRNIDRLHTTELGITRIRRNLDLGDIDVVDWCKRRIRDAGSIITREGKNWYIRAENIVITVNAHSYTIITAHKDRA